ncbi:TetR/AcrR family transcriptional regulator [Kineosporia mesophila]|uniref:TetR/AcrR family transcriptional regulator n=1 Tax=Kineosporia mesophila TaxID=566012 RepID=A0ABP7AMG2_9ACTN|nr:TetR/AcrR family transcriptional regulator [Kineosporia mesophila]MCD5354523.1 TetR/AcrR family transcriptional regulator [Kineosporia mesophila]
MPRTGRPRQFDMDEKLDAALRIFWEFGYDATSLTMLREGLGISSASFYAAFGSKEALFERVLDRYLSGPGTVSEPLEDTSLPPREAVRSALTASAAMQTHASHPSGCLIALGAIGAPESSAPRDLLARRRDVTRQALRECVSRGIAEGELLASVDPNVLASSLHAFLMGLSVEARDGASGATLAASVEQAMSMWDGCAASRR